MEAELTIKDLHVEIDGKEILKGVNLTVRPGEVVALMGPNGSGKSSLAYAIAGHPSYVITKGSITFRGGGRNQRQTGITGRGWGCS